MRRQHLVHLLKHMVNTSTPLLSHGNTETVISCLQCNIRVPTSCSERPSMISEISCSLLAIVAERPVPLCPTLQRRIFPNVTAVDIASEATVSFVFSAESKVGFLIWRWNQTSELSWYIQNCVYSKQSLSQTGWHETWIKLC